jgi:hypothetical protein
MLSNLRVVVGEVKNSLRHVFDTALPPPGSSTRGGEVDVSERCVGRSMAVPTLTVTND